MLVFLAAFFALGVVSQVEAQPRTYSQVVDNSSGKRFSASGAWKVSQNGSQFYGRNYRYAKPARNGDLARFKLRIPETGNYAVYARWPAKRGYNTSTPVGVRTASGFKWSRVNQRKTGGRWVKVGTFRITAGDRDYVRFGRWSKQRGLVVADAVKVVEAKAAPRPADSILGAPTHSQASVERYARSVGSARYIMETIPHYYRLAPRAGIAPDVLVAQAMLETGKGRYGGDSRPWNMAGIKKGGIVGDEPRDFEKPRTAYQGVRMHVNHMAAYTGKSPVGKPHARYYDARAAQKNRGWWVTRVNQLGDGIWATDPAYKFKLQRILNGMDRY